MDARTRAAAAAVILLAAGGCTPPAVTPAVTPPAAPPADACGAAALQTLVGQPEAVLAAMTFPAPVRIIQHGQPITMDFNPARLNIAIDAAGRIGRVFCG